jgi:hypothetical protein
MSGPRGSETVAQAWIELVTEDPEAVSALGVAQGRLAAGRALERLRRLRLIEIRGGVPGSVEVARLLHESTQFYNPHKERCTVRVRAEEVPPVREGDAVLLVWERGGTRRPSAERWWRHETGRDVRVDEGVAWVMTFVPGTDATAGARELGAVRDARHGLLCNPFAQEMRSGAGNIPLPWIDEAESPGETR